MSCVSFTLCLRFDIILTLSTVRNFWTPFARSVGSFDCSFVKHISLQLNASTLTTYHDRLKCRTQFLADCFNASVVIQPMHPIL